MGDCKNNMTTSDKTTDKDGKTSILGSIIPRKKVVDKKEAADTFADNIGKADKKLGDLIIQKKTELNNEKGSELSNSLKLGKLMNMQMHMDAIIELINDYVEIK